MSDSGKQIGDCKHGRPREYCRICELEAKVIALQADKERLDWLENYVRHDGLGKVLLNTQDGSPIREQIDKARSS